MAEFCLDCLNKLEGTDFTEDEVVLMDDLCEGCGKIVPCVVSYRFPLWTPKYKRKKDTGFW